MIEQAINLIRNELANYIEAKRSDDNIQEQDIILDNVAFIDDPNHQNDLKNKIVISLVNVEEESALKNVAVVKKNALNSSLNYTEPPVFLNLYLLFCATMFNGTDHYSFALRRLSLIIQFFQTKRFFTFQNSIQTNIDVSQNTGNQHFRLTAELYTLTFEQINHLWGSLGGKQMPHVMYKFRLVEIQDNSMRQAPMIEEIQIGGNVTI